MHEVDDDGKLELMSVTLSYTYFLLSAYQRHAFTIQILFDLGGM